MLQPIIGHANQAVNPSKLPNTQPWFVHTTAEPCFSHINPAWHTFKQSSPILYISNPPIIHQLGHEQDHARMPQHTTTCAGHNKQWPTTCQAMTTVPTRSQGHHHAVNLAKLCGLSLQRGAAQPIATQNTFLSPWHASLMSMGLCACHGCNLPPYAATYHKD